MSNILLIGYGVSGISVFDFLQSKGNNVLVYDDYKSDGIPNKVTNIDWNNIDYVVKSPSIHIMSHNIHPIIQSAIANNKTIYSTFDIFRIYNPNAKIIGITGTNGKSTTTALIFNILKNAGLSVQMGGNIGIPYGDLEQSEYYVFEMSSYEISSSQLLQFEIGALLNIEPDHLEWHGSFENYIESKQTLLENSKLKVISYEDKYTLSKYINNSEVVLNDNLSDKNNSTVSEYIDSISTVSNNKTLLAKDKGSNNTIIDSAMLCKNNDTLCNNVISNKEILDKNNAPLLNKLENNTISVSNNRNVVNKDNNLVANCRNDIVVVSNNNEPQASYYIKEKLLMHNNDIILDLSNVKYLIGNHNYQNIIFAYAVSKQLNINDNVIINTINNFEPLPHRMNIVRKINNILFVNDSKGTNPDSSAKALDTFVGYKIFWLVGGRSKKIDPLPYIEKYLDSIQKIYLFGESVNEFARIFKSIKEYVMCKTMEEALKHAYSDAINDNGTSVILLSPMCASFDQFQSFEHRGKVFVDLVKSL